MSALRIISQSFGSAVVGIARQQLWWRKMRNKTGVCQNSHGRAALRVKPTRCIACRLLVYPKGDSQALPGYISCYLQCSSASTKWDCFASYRLCIVNKEESKTICRDSWHRFRRGSLTHASALASPKSSGVGSDSAWPYPTRQKSPPVLSIFSLRACVLLLLHPTTTRIIFSRRCALLLACTVLLTALAAPLRRSGKKKSHGWCDFAPAATVLDPRSGFAQNESITITAEILVLNESVAFEREGAREGELPAAAGGGEVLSGKFTWKVHNLALFKEMIKTQKIMSPIFPAGECALRLSVYQSVVARAPPPPHALLGTAPHARKPIPTAQPNRWVDGGGAAPTAGWRPAAPSRGMGEIPALRGRNEPERARRGLRAAARGSFQPGENPPSGE